MHKLKWKCELYSELYRRGSQSLSRKAKIFGIINVIASVAGGTAIFSNLPYQSVAVTIGTGVTMYLLSVMIGINEFLSYRTLAGEYKDASGSFDEVAQMIERQLVQEPRYRQEAHDFLLWIYREYNGVYESSPMLTSKLTKELEKRLAAGKEQVGADSNDSPGNASSHQQAAGSQTDDEDEDSDELIRTASAARSASSRRRRQLQQTDDRDQDQDRRKRTRAPAPRGSSLSPSSEASVASKQSSPERDVELGGGNGGSNGAAYDPLAMDIGDLRLEYELMRYANE
jgi:hypothetical protein